MDEPSEIDFTARREIRPNGVVSMLTDSASVRDSSGETYKQVVHVAPPQHPTGGGSTTEPSRNTERS